MVSFNGLDEIVFKKNNKKKKILITNRELGNVSIKGDENTSIEIRNCVIIGSLVLNRFNHVRLYCNNYFNLNNEHSIIIGNDVSTIEIEKEEINGIDNIGLMANSISLSFSSIGSSNITLKGDELNLNKSYLYSSNIVNDMKTIDKPESIVPIKVKIKGDKK